MRIGGLGSPFSNWPTRKSQRPAERKTAPQPSCLRKCGLDLGGLNFELFDCVSQVPRTWSRKIWLAWKVCVQLVPAEMGRHIFAHLDRVEPRAFYRLGGKNRVREFDLLQPAQVMQ